VTENTTTREVHLSLRDILAITGLVVTLCCVMIGSAVSLKVDMGRLTERLSAVDRRVDLLETLFVPRAPAIRRDRDNLPSGE
jgi:hypothetical protein